MPHVTYQDQFNAFMDYVKYESQSAHIRIWAYIKREMDQVHFDYCFGDDSSRESSARSLLEFAEGKLRYLMGDVIADDIECRMRHMVTHCEVAQAGCMEPHEEAMVWDLWERADEQSAFQDKINMYRNEY